jgi:ABC-2 type transport system permease protein
MNWNRVWAIARWEYLQKVRSKGFIISLILTPVVMVGFSVIPALLADQGPETTQTVGVVDSSGTIFMALKRSMEEHVKLPGGEPTYLLANYMPAGRSYDSALRVADRDALREVIEGTIVISDSAGTQRVVYRSPNPSNIRLIATFEKQIEKLNTESRLAEAGIDSALYSTIARDVDIDAVKVSERGTDESGGFLATFFTAYAGCFLLLLLILTTGQSLVRSLVEEKSNRIMELLVASSRPHELMWGKLIGLSGLGVTQLLVWGILGLGAATMLAVNNDFTSTLASVYEVLPFIVIYMMLGYMFYAAIFIGIGSLVTTEQEAQVANTYLVMLLVTPLAMAVVVIQNPDASYVQAMSWIPIFTPMMMMIRTVTKMPPLWEIGATMAMMVLATSVVVWAAGRIFRTAILLYGKRPSPGEIVRWIRER